MQNYIEKKTKNTQVHISKKNFFFEKQIKNHVSPISTFVVSTKRTDVIICQ